MMTPNSRNDSFSLGFSSATARQIDLVCDDFEQRWQDGKEPSIEEYCQKVGELDRHLLLKELLAVELEWRSKRNENVLEGDYHRRFPQFSVIVEAAFRKLRQSKSESDTDNLQNNPTVKEAIRPQNLPPKATSSHPADTPTVAGYAHGSSMNANSQTNPTPNSTSTQSSSEVSYDGKTLELGPGMIIDEYLLEEKLGQGGMGAVFKARHRRLGKLVALKVVTVVGKDQQAALARFQREIRVAGKLEHANLVEANDAGEFNGILYLVMKLVEGMDLSKLVRELGPLPVADAATIIHQAAGGLEYARQHNLVHRDIKPSNLMLTPEGVVKVLDLGLARLVDDSERSLTGENQLMGTVDYMSPEQAMDAGGVDIRADIYSLGCTLYFLLVGHPPFGKKEKKNANSHLRTLMAHVKSSIPPITQFRQDIPKGMLKVLDKMLAKQPSERFQTPAELADALSKFVAGSNLAHLFQRADGKPNRLPTTASNMSASKPPMPGFRLTVSGAVNFMVITSLILVILIQQWAHQKQIADLLSAFQNKSGNPAQPVETTVTPNQVTTPPPTPNGTTAQTPLTIQRFEIELWNQEEPVGVICTSNNKLSSAAVYSGAQDNLARIHVKLSRPAYSYLLAFCPNGKVFVLNPEGTTQIPPQTDKPAYPIPALDSTGFSFRDGVGLQLILLLVSDKPLPSFEEWAKQHVESPWKTVVQNDRLPEAVYAYDPDNQKINRVESIIRPKVVRGPSAVIEPLKPIHAMIQWAQESKLAFDNMALVAFPIQATSEPQSEKQPMP